MDGLHTWVINLDKDEARLRRITQQLEPTGLAWTRMPAVLGRELPADQQQVLLDAGAYRRKHGKDPALGELGCYLSHLAVMRALLASPHQAALVLEDDALLTPALLPVLQGLMAQPRRWDMVKLSAVHSGTPQPVLALAPGHHLAVMLSRCTGSSAYVVNRRAAEAYVAALLPMTLPYDHVFDQGWTYRLKVRLVTPTPCVHDEQIATTITTGGHNRKFAWHRRLSAHRYRLGNELRRVLYGLHETLRERAAPLLRLDARTG
ncbi:glycosyltransferase family 25 protein [Pseudorhodoferax sp.]|uniref:glycosyltransferase family 25 protein n=1 Tax=Pseudorhodoferax sp. TaxID=1993553 RepID=UPI002DD63EBD|nr:glycosyltransferase family 25 protein [Pseudorhodoferax sp.]